MIETTTEALHSRQKEMLDLYFDSQWTSPRLSKKFGYSETTIRKLVKLEKFNGRERAGKTTHDPRRRENRRPLTPLHDRLGILVSRYCLRENLNMTKFGLLVSLSRLRVGELQSGYYDFTLLQLYRICDVLGTNLETLLKHQGATVGASA